MSIEGTANTEYASLSGKIRTFVIDKSLTISGACADAKATGEAIEKKAGEAAEEYLSKALPSAVDEMIAELTPLIGERAKVVCGTYVGSGTWGENNPCTLTFDFIPKVILFPEYSAGENQIDFKFLLRPFDRASWRSTTNTQNSKYYCNVSWDEKSVSWWTVYDGGAGNPPSEVSMVGGQNNASGTIYHYTAIG